MPFGGDFDGGPFDGPDLGVDYGGRGFDYNDDPGIAGYGDFAGIGGGSAPAPPDRDGFSDMVGKALMGLNTRNKAVMTGIGSVGKAVGGFFEDLAARGYDVDFDNVGSGYAPGFRDDGGSDRFNYGGGSNRFNEFTGEYREEPTVDEHGRVVGDVRRGNTGGEDEGRVEQHTTLTPAQQRLHERLVEQLTEAVDASQNQYAPFENASLEALEQRAIASSNPEVQRKQLQELTNTFTELAGPNYQKAQDTIGDLLDLGPRNIDDYYNAAVRDPLLEDFEENILPGITRRFAGNTLFDTDRSASEGAARDDISKHLARSRAEIAFRERGADFQRQLAAIEALNSLNDRTVGRASARYDRVPQDLATLAQGANTLRSRQAEQVQNALAALRTPEFENIAFAPRDQVVHQKENIGGILGGVASLFDAVF